MRISTTPSRRSTSFLHDLHSLEYIDQPHELVKDTGTLVYTCVGTDSWSANIKGYTLISDTLC